MPIDYPNMRDAIVKMLGIQLPAAPPAPTPDQQTQMDTNARAGQAAMPPGPLSTIRRGMDAASSFVRGLGYNPTDAVPADADASYKAGGLAAAALPLFAPKSIPGMYSRVERLVESLPETISTAKLQSILKSGRVAQEELNWRKVPEFLAQAGPTVSRDALAAHLNANPLDVKVIQKGAEPSTHAMDRLFPDEETVYNNYQIPGYTPGSYREDLLQLPKPGAKLGIEYGANRLISGETGSDFIGQHWDEPNILVHARHNERNLPATSSQLADLNQQLDVRRAAATEHFNFDTLSAAHEADRAVRDAKGPKGRMLENIQSDWHQRGIKGGYYDGPTPPADPAMHNGYGEAEHAARRLENHLEQIGQMLQLPDGWQGGLDVHEQARMLGNHVTERARQLDAAAPGSGEAASWWNHHAQLQNERVAYDNAIDAMYKFQHPPVPNAPFKDAWPELAIKQQLLDIAHNHPDTKWVGIPPAHVLQARGEDISSAFQDQQLPRTLEKLMRPLGGQVGPIDTGVKTNGLSPRYTPHIQPAGGFSQRTPFGGDDPIYNFLPQSHPAYTGRDIHDVDTLRDQIEAQRPNIIAKGTHLTPEILAQIREKGFPLLAALAAARAGGGAPTYFQPQPSHTPQP